MKKVLFLALTLALSSCGQDAESSSPTAVFGEVDLSEVQASQQEALADGEVTIDEYNEGYEAFRSCAEERGGTVETLGVDPASGLIAYSTATDIFDRDSSGELSVEGQCYSETFIAIEATFETTNPAAVAAAQQGIMDAFDLDVRPCLEANDVLIPDGLVVDSADWDQLTIEFSQLQQSGAC